MKPIKITVTGANALVTEKPAITSGMVGLPVEFTFDEAWNGLGKTAVFRAGSRSYPVSCAQSTAIVPWEVLEKGGVGLYIGVFGADEEGTVKIPTVWACADTIAAGTQIPETVPAEPTPNLYDQILTAASKAVETANSVRQDADSGKFIGPAGPKGDAGAVDFTVVAQLPEVGDSTKLYLLPESDDTANRFGEYVFVEGAWERIGSAGVEVNLKEYVKITDFATAVKQVQYDSGYKYPGGSDGTYYGLLYARKFDDTECCFPVCGQNRNFTIPVRDHQGNFYVNTPASAYHCATKGYVDNLIAELAARVEALESVSGAAQ